MTALEHGFGIPFADQAPVREWMSTDLSDEAFDRWLFDVLAGNSAWAQVAESYRRLDAGESAGTILSSLGGAPPSAWTLVALGLSHLSTKQLCELIFGGATAEDIDEWLRARAQPRD